MKKLSLEDYQNKLKELYGIDYTIACSEFIGAFSKVIVYCPIHKTYNNRQLHNICYKSSKANPCHKCAITQ